jgi:hypothetical protein
VGHAKLCDQNVGSYIFGTSYEPVDHATRNLARKIAAGRTRRRSVENDGQGSIT